MAKPTAKPNQTQQLRGGNPLVEEDGSGGYRPEVVVRPPGTGSQSDPDANLTTRDRPAAELLEAILEQLLRTNTLLELIADEDVDAGDT